MNKTFKLVLALFVAAILIGSLSVPSTVSAKNNPLTASLGATTPWRAGTQGTVTVYVSSDRDGQVTIDFTNVCGASISTDSFLTKKGENYGRNHNVMLPANTPLGACEITANVTLYHKITGKFIDQIPVSVTITVTPPPDEFPRLQAWLEDDTLAQGQEILLHILWSNNTADPVNFVVEAQVNHRGTNRNQQVIQTPFTAFDSFCSRDLQACKYGWETGKYGIPAIEVGSSYEVVIRTYAGTNLVIGSYNLGYVTLNPGNIRIELPFTVETTP